MMSQQSHALFPRRDRGQSTQIGHVTASESSRIRCTTGLPHQENQKEVVPHLKACPVPWNHVHCSDCDPSFEHRWKRRFPRRSVAVSPEKVSPRDRGQLFNKRHRRGETRKKDECFPLPKRIPGLKCVNSGVNSVSILPNQFPQVGPWHHVGATMEITLDKKLIHHRISWELNPIHAKPNKTKKQGSPLRSIHRKFRIGKCERFSTEFWNGLKLKPAEENHNEVRLRQTYTKSKKSMVRFLA